MFWISLSQSLVDWDILCPSHCLVLFKQNPLAILLLLGWLLCVFISENFIKIGWVLQLQIFTIWVSQLLVNSHYSPLMKLLVFYSIASVSTRPQQVMYSIVIKSYTVHLNSHLWNETLSLVVYMKHLTATLILSRSYKWSSTQCSYLLLLADIWWLCVADTCPVHQHPGVTSEFLHNRLLGTRMHWFTWNIRTFYLENMYLQF